MNRRSFFKFLPIAPLALVAEGARAATADGAPIPEATRITFSGNKKKAVKPYGSSGSTLTSLGGWSMNEADYSKEVSMAVGDDGHLWLKRKDGEWKRIVTE